jgi:dihydrofolate reductase
VIKDLLDMGVSLDRFVAGPNCEDGGLHDRFFSPAGGEAVAESVRNTGAILLGRQTYDQGDGLDGFAGSPYAVERFVVTHRAPERAVKGQMTFTFVTEGVELPSSGRTCRSGPLLR